MILPFVEWSWWSPRVTAVTGHGELSRRVVVAQVAQAMVMQLGMSPAVGQRLLGGEGSGNIGEGNDRSRLGS